MNILVCPNAYKGALGAADAAQAIIKGLESASPKFSCRSLPIADGGDGSLYVIARYLETEIFGVEVAGPLGAGVTASYGWHGDGQFAVIELAEASGIHLCDELDPWSATTVGTGQLIKTVVERGASRVYLTVGGSATVDGAIGILHALGVEFYENQQLIINPKPSDFQRITRIDMELANKLMKEVRLTVLCDVTNPLVGAEGAARVFGPQKGLGDRDIEWFDGALAHLADLVEASAGVRVHELAHGGAAGGVAAILHGLFGAELVHGGEKILEWAAFGEHLSHADLVVTGEGKIDQQTSFGKGPGLVAKKAKSSGKQVLGLSGSVRLDTGAVEYFDAVLPIINEPCTLKEAMNRTAANLERMGEQVGNMLKMQLD